MDIVGRRTLASIFESYARLRPEKIWMIFEDAAGQCRQWSYGEFDAWANQTAHWLLAQGLRAGDKFTAQLPNTPALVVLALAAAKRGAVMVPADPGATADELGYLVEHSESKLLVGEEPQEAVLEEVANSPGVTTPSPRAAARGLSARGLVRLVYSRSKSGESFESQVSEQPAARPSVRCQAEDVAHMLYTSGTTSRPKGVLLTHAALIFGAEVFCRAVLQRSEDRHIIALPLFHAAAQCHALWPTLASGGSIALMERFSASGFFEQAIRHKATLAALFGAPLRYILATPEDPQLRENRLRNVTFAQNLTAAQYDEWHRRFGAPLQQLWGMTETVGLPVMSPLYGRRNLPAMGKPVLGYEVRVVDGARQEVGPDEDGELVVRGIPGRTLMLGYFKNPEATAQTLWPESWTQTAGLRERAKGEPAKGESASQPVGQPVEVIAGGAPQVVCWLQSGDTVRYDEEGWIYFVDRGKDLIKRAGKNIAPAEIEAVIKAHPAVADCAVIGLPDEMADERVVALVILKGGTTGPACTAQASEPAAGSRATVTLGDELLALCRGKLSAYKVPAEVEFVAEFPRTSVGKVQKHVLRAERLKRERAR